MAARPKPGPRLVAANGARTPAPRRNRENLFALAYERLEEMTVTCELRPGRLLAMQELQDMTGFGRTPVHQAVSRLAADTLITIRPRHGLQIAPIDLARERVLLRLRRDLERFVIRLAAERSGPTHRNQLLHMTRTLRQGRKAMTISEFNLLDRRIDRLIMAAAGEPFLEHTLRPLHTMSRRIGWIYHNWVAAEAGLHQTVDCHLDILDAVANRHVEAAVAAADRLIDFADSMFDRMEREIDPALLDCSLDQLPQA
ncbi:MAG: GntR family transcriptional regulator [Rhodospirillales bacterium]|nr:GntR family transcriptional regulator [Rhodospirillales bacterium]